MITTKEFEVAEEYLTELGVLEEVIKFATCTYGYSIKTLEDILYWATGYHSFDQLDDFKEFTEAYGIYL